MSLDVGGPIIVEDSADLNEDDFEMMLEAVSKIMKSFAPEVEFGLSGRATKEPHSDHGQVYLTFTFDKDAVNKLGLFLGSHVGNIRTIFNYIDSQRICPTNKHVRITLNKSGEEQNFKDINFLDRFVFGRNGE